MGFCTILYYNIYIMSLEIAENLQKISQCLYNINKILKAYLIEPVEIDKKLNRFYLQEKSKLSELLNTKLIPSLSIDDPDLLLAKDLIFNNGETRLLREQIEQAQNYLSKGLGEVEELRMGDTISTTGIEEGGLKKYLEIYLTKKKLANELETHNQQSALINRTSENRFWITKDGGQYFFDGSPVDIRNKKADYAKIFDATFSLKPEGGEIKYTDIVTECLRRGVIVKKSSILRALSGNSANFFHYIKDIKQAPGHGVFIFRPKQDGRALEFNNQKI